MRRNGFTLIEVLVALTLATVVVLLAHKVFTAVVDGAQRVREARAQLDRAANARRWLVEAFGSLAVDRPQDGGFDGEPQRVAFGTWLPTAAGGFRPARVSIDVQSGWLRASVAGGDSLLLADGVAAIGFDYLLEPGANERWVSQWISPVSAPVAVRMRVTRKEATSASGAVDTLLLLVGPRG
jgi:prepilin-type N-terminal cleavage/methylation domain-containing protein